MRSSDIPSRKGVHFRKTSESEKSHTKPTSSSAKVSPSSPISAKPTESDHTPRKAPASINTAARPDRSMYTSSKPLRDYPDRKKTPAEISRDKELSHKEKLLSARLSAEIKKTDILKKELRIKDFKRFKKKFLSTSVAVLFGSVIFAFLASLVLFFYYRSITKYSDHPESFSINFYEYLDPEDTNEKNIKKYEARKKGNEKPALSLENQIYIKDSSAFIPFSLVKDFLGLSVAGNNNSRTITAGSSNSEYSGNNTVQFTFDSNEISVNGSVQMLQNQAFIHNDDFYFPYEFIESYVRGIEIDKSVDGNHTDISITKTSPVVYFGGSSNDSIETPEFDEYFSDSQSMHNYTIDVSAYEKYISPEDSDKYLTVVNKTHMLSENYVPNDLTDVVTNKSKPIQQICFDAAMALKAMLLAADADGYGDLVVDTGYRSYAYQSNLYNSRLEMNLRKYDKEEAERITAKTIIYPGSSDHQTGLAVDIHNLPQPMQTFSNSDEYKWLIEHCADFGFILRYPQTKESITGVRYEPWHFRFVGREHAQAIMSQGITLEEYVSNLNLKPE